MALAERRDAGAPPGSSGPRRRRTGGRRSRAGRACRRTARRRCGRRRGSAEVPVPRFPVHSTESSYPCGMGRAYGRRMEPVIEVREIGEDDWRAWRAMRLAALATDPTAFGSTLAEWSGPNDLEARWRARLAGSPFSALVDVDGRTAGMVAAYRPQGAGRGRLAVGPSGVPRPRRRRGGARRRRRVRRRRGRAAVGPRREHARDPALRALRLRRRGRLARRPAGAPDAPSRGRRRAAPDRSSGSSCQQDDIASAGRIRPISSCCREIVLLKCSRRSGGPVAGDGVRRASWPGCR